MESFITLSTDLRKLRCV